MKLKPYPEYKDARITWLEKIPAHWQENRAKFLFREIDERSSSGEEELLSVSHITGVTPRSQKNVTMFKAESYVGHKVCQPGDIVINTMWAWMAALGVSKHTGIVSPSYGVYRPRDQQNFLPEYIDQVLRTWGFVAEYNTRSTGIRSSRLRLYPDQFLDISMPVPPIKEQQKMIDYLKFENQKINRFIRNKRSLIKLLNEQKQVIINQAVTRGINPKASSKSHGTAYPSGIPEHWDFAPLKRFCDVVDCKHVTVDFIEEGYPLASVREVQSFELNLSRSKRTDKSSYEFLISDGRKPKKGDIIYCRNTSVGASAIVTCDDEFAMGQDVCLIRPHKHNEFFLNYFLQSNFLKSQLDQLLVGATFKRINVEDIRLFMITCPPWDEQNDICHHIRSNCDDINTAIIRIQREIELIQEYRTRLISNVVTGKIDVRDIEIPALPDEDVVEELEDEELLEEAEAELEEDGNTDE